MKILSKIVFIFLVVSTIFMMIGASYAEENSLSTPNQEYNNDSNSASLNDSNSTINSNHISNSDFNSSSDFNFSPSFNSSSNSNSSYSSNSSSNSNTVTVLSNEMGILAIGDDVYVSTNGSDSNDGYTPGTAKLTIAAAIATVNPGGIIYILGGTYSGTGNYGLTISQDLTIMAYDLTQAVIIDGLGTNQIMTISASVNLEIYNINFVNAYTSGNGGVITATPGMFATFNLNITLNNCTFKNNRASGEGGAIYFIAIGSGALGSTSSNLTVINCIFTNNTGGNYGGAMSISTGNLLYIENSSFNNNTAHSSGAIEITLFNAIMINSNFTENAAIGGSTGYGGVMNYQYGPGNVTVNNCIFTNNTAYSNGGVFSIYSYQGLIYLNVNNSSFTGNFAGNDPNESQGGAIYNRDGVITVNNSNFTNNGANIRGGAIGSWSGNSNAGLFVTGCNFVNNYVLGSDSTASGAIFILGNHPVQINYNRFFNNMDINNNQTVYVSNALSSGNLSFNWWGNNNLPSLGSNALNIINNYFVVNVVFDSSSRGMAYFNYTIRLNNNGSFNPNELPEFFGNDIRYPNFYNGTFLANSSGTISIPLNGNYGNITFNFTVDNWTTSITEFITAVTNSTINVPSSVVAGVPFNISGVLTDDAGDFLANVVLNISVGGNTFTVTTGASGQWLVSYVLNFTGNFIVSVAWDGNTSYLAFSNSTSVNVYQLTLNSTINVPSGGVVNQIVTIGGVLTDEFGNSVSGLVLNITINGVYFTATTDGSGGWSLLYNATVSGNLSVLVSWTGNTTYIGFSNATVLDVRLLNINSTINVLSGVVVDQIVTIGGVLIDEFGNPVVGVVLNITVNGVYFSVTTDGSGGWSLLYNATVSGALPIFVSWGGNNTYNAFINTSALAVSPLYSNSTIVVPSSVVAGVSFNISGVLTNELGEALDGVVLNLTIGGNTFAVTTNGSGEWSFVYTIIFTGNFLISVTWEGNNTDIGFTNSTTVGVYQLAVNSTINVPSGVVNQSITIGGVLFDQNNNPVSGVTLNITINGQLYTEITNSSGEWSLSYISLVSGNLSVSVSWAGNTTYIGFFNSTLLNVRPLNINSTIIVPSGLVDVDQIVTIGGVLIDEFGNPVVGLVLNITVNGVYFSVTTDSSGGWSLLYNATVSGALPIFVSWGGNNTYNAFINTSALAVSPLYSNSTIVVPSSVVAGVSFNISGVLTDELGEALDGVVLNLTIGGNTFTVTTNASGQWIMSYILNSTGNVLVSVSWGGNNNYIGFTNSTTVSVYQLAINSTINVPSGVVNQPITIGGILLDQNNNPVSGVTLNITINGVYFTATTDSAGGWTLSYTPIVSANLSVLVSWAGNTTYIGFSNSTALNVRPLNISTSTINIPSLVDINQTISISGFLLDEFGNPVSGLVLNITINGQNFNATTNGSGAWSLSYTPSIGGNLSVFISWTGNETYANFSNSTILAVNLIKSNSTIIIPSYNIITGQTITISGILINEYNNPVSGAILNITVAGRTFSVTTNGSGEWSLSYVPQLSGNLSVSISWGGNDIYDSFTNTSSFTVTMSNSSSTVSVPSNGIVNEVVNISGTVTNTFSNPISNIPVTVVINGLSYTVTTNSNGNWVLPYNLSSAGIINGYASWNGNGGYAGFNYTFSINVSKIYLNSTIVVPTSASVGQTITISGVVRDQFGRGVSNLGFNTLNRNRLANEFGNLANNMAINLIIAGISYVVTTDSNGVWSLSYKVTQVGNITVEVTFSGDNIFSNFTNSTSFNVISGEVNTTISAKQNPNGSVTIKAILTDASGDPLKNITVDILLDGKVIGTGTTDKNGRMSFIIPSRLLTGAKYKISIRVEGDSNFNSGVSSITFKNNNTNNNINNNTNNNTNKTTNNPFGKINMKDSGVPIIAILLIFTLLATLVSRNIIKK